MRKKRWTRAWSRCCALEKCESAGRQQTAADLQQISNYLKDRHPRYRLATVRKIYTAIQSLKDWSHLGRAGREEGTRELLFPPLPYVAVYRVTQHSIEVLRIYHGAQDRS